MKKNDDSQPNTTPEIENFLCSEYHAANFIPKYLVDRYFNAVEKLINKATDIKYALDIGGIEGRTMRLKKIATNLIAFEYVEDLIGKFKAKNP